MDFPLKNMLFAIDIGLCSNKELRGSVRILLKLYHGVMQRLVAHDASTDDLCTVMSVGESAYAVYAADRLLADPRCPNSALMVILGCVPERADAAAKRLMASAPDKRMLSVIVAKSNLCATRAATRLMAAGASDDDLALIVARVPLLRAEAAAKLGGGYGGDLSADAPMPQA